MKTLKGKYEKALDETINPRDALQNINAINYQTKINRIVNSNTILYIPILQKKNKQKQLKRLALFCLMYNFQFQYIGQIRIQLPTKQDETTFIIFYFPILKSV